MVTGVKKLGGTLGSVAAGGLKVFTAGVAAASAGVAVLGKKAVESFADYEQLVGGIETLFGTGGLSIEEYAQKIGKSVEDIRGEFQMLSKEQEVVLMHANEAYKTAGLSANEYMETVSSFAASLKQSTKSNFEAVQSANQAVIDMSDNANKMGTDMTMIQNAYQGFAKQNYTMLDNLKLGYGGTKEEMQRLLEDAEKLSGIKYDISNLNDVFSAIHVIQEELGITGTTAKEASTTISGSLNMTKAAWSNMLVAMTTDSMDFDTAVNNLVESAAVAAENLLPRIEATLNGMGKLIEALLPVIMARVPAIINDVLPDLIQSGIGMITSLVEGIHQNLPQIMESGAEILSSLASGIMESGESIGGIAVDILTFLTNALIENLPSMVDGATKLLVGLINLLSDNLPDMVDAAVTILTKLGTALVENAPELADAVHELVDTILDELEELCPAISPITDAIQLLIDNFDAVMPVIIGLTAAFVAWKAAVSIAGLINTFTIALNGMTIAQKIATMAQNLLNASMLANPIVLIVTLIAGLVAAFIYLWNTNEEFRQFWIEVWESIKTAFSDAITAIVEFFTVTLPEAFNSFVELLTGIWESVKEGWNSFVEFIAGFATGIQETLMEFWNTIVQFFTVNVPQFISAIITFISELPGKILDFLLEIIANVIVWGGDMLMNAQKAGSEFITGVINFVSQLPGRIWNFLKNIIANVTSWAGDMLSKAQKAGSDFVSGVVNFVQKLPGKIKEFIDDIIKKVTTFVTDFGNKAKEAGEEFFDRITGALSDLPDKMVEIGSNIISGIWNGISSGWDWLVGKVKEVAGSLLGAAEEELDINSPSREFKWIGEMCVAGFDEGIEDLMNPTTMTRNVKASFAAMQSNLPSGGNGKTGGSGGFSQTIIVNREISTADELARAVRVESRYGLMRGVPVG